MMKLMRDLAVGLSLCLIALPASADDSKQAVKVTLLDMTALFSAGYATGGPGGMMGGYGGRGPGMMGGGYGFMGPNGMMGGYGPGGGPGFGPMMGGGMMGMMSIRASRESVPQGKVSFDVTNLSRSFVHEMLVVAVDSADAPLPYDYKTWRVPEEQVKVIGETDEMQPNAEKTVELDLKPGHYLLICNVPGHFSAGMVTPLAVTQ